MTLCKRVSVKEKDKTKDEENKRGRERERAELQQPIKSANSVLQHSMPPSYIEASSEEPPAHLPTRWEGKEGEEERWRRERRGERERWWGGRKGKEQGRRERTRRRIRKGNVPPCSKSLLFLTIYKMLKL